MPILQTENLSKAYGHIKAVHELNLTIEKGNVYGLLGPNGSGKTTTLGLILGILQASKGSYEWFDGKYGKNARMKIGAILETPNFYPFHNAVNNLKIIQHIKKSYDDDLDALLKMVNLYHRKDTKFSSYSLGMKQRLAIAATMIGDPEVLIFDEPTNGLDPQGIAEVRSTLKDIAATGKTIIFASHILHEVEKICNHVAIIKNGNLLAVGPIGSILQKGITIELKAAGLENLVPFLKDIKGISNLEWKGDLLLVTAEENINPGDINALAFSKDIALTHLKAGKRKLEEEFLEITK